MTILNRALAKIRRLAENLDKTWCPCEESNLDLRLRRPAFYPLNYKDSPLIG